MRKKTILTIITALMLIVLPLNISAKKQTTNKKQEKIEMVGKATYYGEHYSSNRKTASGEKYSKTHLTAAHRTIPFGTKVKVFCQETGKTVIVKINDRGPYSKGRIIDLSVAAAKKLDIMNLGVATVKITCVK